MSAERTTGPVIPVPSGAPADLPEKLSRLRSLARDGGVSTLVLQDPATLAWLLGCRVHVPQTLDAACLDVVVEDADGSPALRVVTNAIEAPRLRDTELAGVTATWDVVPWWGDRGARLPSGPGVGADRPRGGSVDVGADLASARCLLTAHQQELLGEVCRDTAAAATAAAARIGPTTTEYAAAGELSRELLERALDPVVLMVAGDARIAPHRHPLPTSSAVGRRAMLVCCARRHGLVSSLTRFVAFDGYGSEEADAYARLLEVEAVFLDATRPGATLGAVVSAGAAAYGDQGFDPLEWHRHHQGGLTGLRPREAPASPDAKTALTTGNAVGWNPSGGGWKVEDTSLVTADGPVPLVEDPAWPTLLVGGRRRPDVLVP